MREAPDDDGRDSVFAEVQKAWTGDDSGLGIGTAVAISGAAANPNAGYRTSPGVAFLLTIFNARLGWWIGNPRFDKWRKPSPATGLFYLLSDLFGFSGVDRKFVQLSDGGHFDNMGLYELVRRRCRLEECGHIVYLKASLTRDEPIDVLEYRSRHSEFPHQTTGDQF